MVATFALNQAAARLSSEQNNTANQTFPSIMAHHGFTHAARPGTVLGEAEQG